MKRKLTFIIALILALGLMHSNAFAEKGHHGKGRHGYGMMAMSDMFIMKAKMIYKNQEVIGVSEDQMKQIKSLKMELKKDSIRKTAEIKILKIDIRSLMHKDQIDVAAVNKLVDQKYEIKKAKTKKAVGAFAKLKKIITKEQMAKLKKLMKDKRKSHGSGGYQHGSQKDPHKKPH